MNFNFGQYVICSANEYAGFSSRTKFSMPGITIYPIGVPIPVIVKGKGCGGNAVISNVSYDENSTTITFSLSEVSKEVGNAIYSLYRGQASTSGQSADSYEDQFIPGAMRKSSGVSFGGSSSRKSRGGSEWNF